MIRLISDYLTRKKNVFYSPWFHYIGESMKRRIQDLSDLDNPDETRVLLTQLQECSAFVRNFDILAWQTFSITLTILTLLAIPYLGYAKDNVSRLALLGSGIIFLTVAIVYLKKTRFAQIVKNTEFAIIQERLLEKYPSMVEIKFKTEDILKALKENPTEYQTKKEQEKQIKPIKPDIFSRLSAYNFLFTALCLCWVGIFFLICLEVSRSLGLVLV
jgi:hypothetical protein